MKVRHTLICFFFLSLQDGNTGLTNAQITSVHTGTEGGDIRVTCSFSSYGTSMFFCKRECKPEDILIKTTGVRDQRGRYSITYEGGENVVVSITQLTKSDSGLYRCGLGGSNITFEIIVVDALQDGNTGLTNAQIPSVHTGTEGGDVEVRCPFSSYGTSMFFCKRECKPEDILIHTTGVRDQRGRYSIRYDGGGNVFVSITQLTKSDSGLYRCGLGGSNITFEIIVVDALLDGSPPEDQSLYTRAGGNIVVGCSFTFSGRRRYFCKEECEEKDILVETTGYTAERGRYSIRYTQRSLTDVSVYVSITQLTESDSGRYRCGLERRLSPDSYRGFEIIVTDGWASTSTLLYAVLIPVIIVILSGLTLMKICIQRNTKPKGLQTRGNSDGTNMEIALYENCPPVSTSESTYESLDPANRDQNQTYSTLTHTHNTNDAVCVSLSTATLP